MQEDRVPEIESVRVDRWLWSVRIFKTRSQAVLACRSGRVELNGVPVKASKLLCPGDELKVKRGKVLHQLKVLELLEKRVGAKDVDRFKENLVIETEPEEVMPSGALKPNVSHPAGEGRPTKRRRRRIDAFLDEVNRGARL